MDTQLERLLDSIDPQRTADGLQQRADRVFNAFTLSSARARSGSEVRDILVRFWRKMRAGVLDIDEAYLPRDDQHDWDRCQEILRRIYKRPDGWKAAAEFATTGIDGGLYGVLKRFANQLVLDRVREVVSQGVQSLWWRIPFERRLSIIAEYLKVYRRVLPPQLRDRGAADLHESFPKILTEHPFTIRPFRRLGNH